MKMVGVARSTIVASVLLASSNAFALVEFVKSACYQMTGRVEKVESDSITLGSYLYTRSETKYRIELDEKPTGVEVGMFVRLPALIQIHEDHSIDYIRAKVSEIRLITPTDKDKVALPKLLGEPGTNQCPAAK